MGINLPFAVVGKEQTKLLQLHALGQQQPLLGKYGSISKLV